MKKTKETQCNCENKQYTIIEGDVKEITRVKSKLIYKGRNDDEQFYVYSYVDDEGLTQEISIHNGLELKADIFNCYASAHNSICQDEEIEELKLKIKALEERLPKDEPNEPVEINEYTVVEALKNLKKVIGQSRNGCEYKSFGIDDLVEVSFIEDKKKWWNRVF